MDDAAIKEMLTNMKRVAVVGLSPREDRASHGITRWLVSLGVEVVGVNPGHDSILDLPVYPDLASVPGTVDIVDIFRRSDAVPPIVASALDRGDRAIWMQEGVVHEEAARQARDQDVPVVVDRCIYKEWLRLLNG